MTKIAVLGAGISGLSTAYALEKTAERENLEIEVVILEKLERTGGKVMSVKTDGFLCEWGPNGFLDNKPMTLDLCRSLGVDANLLRSNDNARKRFIYAGGTLHRLPETAGAFLKSGLISWPGKLRLGCEMLITPNRGDDDETLADFARRRLGGEALERLIGPMVSGIFAGDPETMSLRSCFPRIYQLEQEYGGLIKAMAKLGRQKRAERKAGKQVASAAGPGGILTSFAGGIQDLTDALVEKLTAEIRVASGVARLETKEGGFLLHLEDETVVEADMVVSAAPAHALATMLKQTDAQAASLLQQIPYAPMNIVCFGYERDKISRDLSGFGYLIARGEKRHTLGTLWDSSIFPNRAPRGQVLLRSMYGGATNPQAIELSEDEVRNKTMADLKLIMGIDAEPDFVKVFRHRRAIPQYVPGHGRRLLELDERLAQIPGLFLTGNAFFGVGINDCVNASNRIAQKVIETIEAKK